MRPCESGLGIVAGSGALPQIIADHCRAEGRPYQVYGVENFAGDWTYDHPGQRLDIWSLVQLAERLKKSGCGEVCLAGAVRRPSFADRPMEAPEIERLREAFGKGDDSLLRAVTGMLVETGVRLVGVQDVVPNLLAAPGHIAGPKVTPDQQIDTLIARRIVRAIGSLDLGQAAVVADGRCLGVEVVDGTDALLRNITAMDEFARGGVARGVGVLVKAPKPQQDRRLDLPTVGPETVEGVAKAGLRGIAVEAEGVLLVDRKTMKQSAESLDVGVWAFVPE